MLKMVKNGEITKDDLQKVAELHSKYLKDTVLGVFGTDFLNDLYEGIVNSGYGAVFVCKEDSKVVGFIAGAIDTGKIIKSLFFKRLTSILPHIIRHPRLVINGMQSVMFHSTGVKAELLPILVVEKYRKMGIGKMLMGELMTYFKSRGIREFKILTDVRNEEGNNFYRKMGFRLVKTIRLLGKEVNCYIAKVE